MLNNQTYIVSVTVKLSENIVIYAPTKSQAKQDHCFLWTLVSKPCGDELLYYMWLWGLVDVRETSPPVLGETNKQPATSGAPLLNVSWIHYEFLHHFMQLFLQWDVSVFVHGSTHMAFLCNGICGFHNDFIMFSKE